MVAPRNRIARHLDAPPAPPIPPKEDLKGRYQFMSDAVLKAVAAVTRLLDDDDPAVVMKAAKMILDLDKTRMRHGQQVHGLYKPDYLDVLQTLGPVPSDRHRLQAEVAEEDEDEQEELAVSPVVLVAPASEPVSTDATPARRPVPQEKERVEHPLPVPESGPGCGGHNPDGSSEFGQWLTRFYAEKFPHILAAAPRTGDSARKDGLPASSCG